MTTTPQARPFLKWAGGKTQLLPQLRQLYPPQLKTGALKTYVEPFLGGGAVFFDVMQNYNIESAFLCDANPELILIYQVVQQQIDDLITKLQNYAETYLQKPPEGRKEYYYQVRTQLNQQLDEIDFAEFSELWIDRAAMHLFLNKTCYNGLFRLNSRGQFNTPHGRYKNPRIVDEENLRAASSLLQRAQIRRGDFADCESMVDDSTFVYFDPPYRPLNNTSYFTSYSARVFDDAEQQRLARFYAKLAHSTDALLMLSNSDPTNEDENDRFFDELYQEFYIHRVSAQRNINSKVAKRGAIRELVITNYSL